MMRLAWLGFASIALVAGLAVLGACREPTAIIVEITTDMPCADVASAGGVDVRVGTASAAENAPTTHVQATQCTGGRIGSITIVPSGESEDQVGLVVAVATKANSSLEQGRSTDCSSDTPGNCIIAKRVLRYIPHTQLQLPIHLGQACAGSSCADGESCDPVDGKCKPVDECTRNPDACNPPTPPPSDGGVIDGGPPCVLCGGTTCVDFTTDPNNCGACNSRCAGTCEKGACRLDANAKVSDADGCLAVDANTVMWDLTGNFTGALAYVSNGGALAGKVLASNTNFGNISGGAGFSTLSFLANTSTALDYLGAPPVPSSLAWVISGPGSFIATGRSSAGTRCATYVDNLGKHTVGCPPKFAATALPGKGGPIAVGKTYWATIANPDTPTSAVVVGDFSGALLAGAPQLAQAHAIAVIPGSDGFFVATGNAIKFVGYDSNAKKFLVLDVFAGNLPILGLRAEARIYFVDKPATQDHRLRRLTWTLNTGLVTAAPVIASAPMSDLGGIVCVDSDAFGVYYLSNGVPYRRPR